MEQQQNSVPVGTREVNNTPKKVITRARGNFSYYNNPATFVQTQHDAANENAGKRQSLRTRGIQPYYKHLDDKGNPVLM